MLLQREHTHATANDVSRCDYVVFMLSHRYMLCSPAKIIMVERDPTQHVTYGHNILYKGIERTIITLYTHLLLSENPYKCCIWRTENHQNIPICYSNLCISYNSQFVATYYLIC